MIAFKAFQLKRSDEKKTYIKVKHILEQFTLFDSSTQYGSLMFGRPGPQQCNSLHKIPTKPASCQTCMVLIVPFREQRFWGISEAWIPHKIL